MGGGEGILSEHFSLHPQHLQDLRKSDLSDETIREACIYSVTPRDINKKLGFNDPSVESMMAFPYPGQNGFERYKPFPIRAAKKYLQPKGSLNHLYIPDRVRSILSDPSIPLFITEGEKKVLKAIQEGLQCIGVSGWWNWSGGNKTLISDFDDIVLKDRKIILIPDSDWKSINKHGYGKNIKPAIYELAGKLAERGAKIFLKELTR